MKILVVDNHPLILRFLHGLFVDKGYSVRTAHNGLSALILLKTFVPDIMFVDLVMPQISGDKLCRIVRRNPELDDVRIVILSAIASEQTVDVKELGANALLSKGPFDEMRRQVLDIVKRLAAGDLEWPEVPALATSSHQVREITRELLSSRHHLEAILGNLSEAILELTTDGAIVYVNQSALEILQSTEATLLGSTFVSLLAVDEREQLIELLDRVAAGHGMPVMPVTVNVTGKILQVKLLEVHHDYHSVVVILDDVSDKKRLESQIERARRMEAMGIVAGGVAHDLNNILGALVTLPEAMLLEAGEDNPFREDLETVQKAGRKAATIVHDLLTLARRGVPSKEVIDLNLVVAEYLASPEHGRLASFHPEVHVTADLAADVGSIRGSMVHLSKVIMNLVSNAAEAIVERGVVTITTENLVVGSRNGSFPALGPGSYSVIRVTDTGVGLSTAEVERIFEPFYSKKVMGRSGTGLGMAIVWGTVRDHGGIIDIQSVEGEGTEMRLVFPSLQEKQLSESSPVMKSGQTGLGETILVVDDVEEQRRIACRALTRLGYEVAAVSNGEEAVDFVRDHSPDLVVLDMIMAPGIDGLETYRRMSRVRSGQKAIIVSGFSETERVREAQELGAGPYIGKPFSFEGLGTAVRSELDR